MLGVSVRTVQTWVDAGVLPAWRSPGGFRRISRLAVEKYAQERSRITGAAFLPAERLDELSRPLRLLVAACHQQSINECFAVSAARQGAVSISLYPDIADLLLQFARQNPDGVFLCSDDFDVCMGSVANAMQSCTLGGRRVPVLVYSRNAGGALQSGTQHAAFRPQLLHDSLSMVLLEFSSRLRAAASGRLSERRASVRG